MDTASTSYYLSLIESKHLQTPLISSLFREYGSAQALLELPSTRLQEMGFSGLQVDQLKGVGSEAGSNRRVQEALEWADKEENHLLCYESPHYPALLREISSAPPLLFVRGSLSALSVRQLAFVGSRRATHYGKRNAYWIASELSAAGFQISSGMASGIDSKAHEGALDSGNPTLAVIGTGIDRVYPSGNKRLAQRIVEHGALVSEFPLGTPPYASNFPRRNRIISGLSLGTLVVEANLKSGSLITARLAMEQNRDVFAVPGPIASPQSRGCHHLIKQGAKLVEGPQDILEELGVVGQSSGKGDGKEKKTVEQDPCSKLPALEAIDHQGCLFQAILDESGLAVQELNIQLIELEAAGLIRQQGGRYFRRE